jgi:hypothetical protein
VADADADSVADAEAVVVADAEAVAEEEAEALAVAEAPPSSHNAKSTQTFSIVDLVPNILIDLTLAHDSTHRS